MARASNLANSSSPGNRGPRAKQGAVAKCQLGALATGSCRSDPGLYHREHGHTGPFQEGEVVTSSCLPQNGTDAHLLETPTQINHIPFSLIHSLGTR